MAYAGLNLTTPASGEALPKRDIQALFRAAEAKGQVGLARKSKPVDARPARTGEKIDTFIVQDGKRIKETTSKPAAAGDMVVRNRCPETGNEEYLVAAKAFAERYDGPHGDAGGDGWREYRPIAKTIRFFILEQSHPSFVFTAPWGEEMVADPGDAIVQDPRDPADTYRVAASSFACTYEIQKNQG